jgi:hypothetical protein
MSNIQIPMSNQCPMTKGGNPEATPLGLDIGHWDLIGHWSLGIGHLFLILKSTKKNAPRAPIFLTS